MLDAQGITTFNGFIGSDLARGFTGAANVVYSQIRHIAGGTLFIGLQSVTGGTTLAAVGAVLPVGTATDWTTIWGPAGFQLAAGGATAAVTVIQGLSKGVSGY